MAPYHGRNVAGVLFGGETALSRTRRPEIMADAAYTVLRRTGNEWTGRTLIDHEVLAAEGITDTCPAMPVSAARST